MKIYQPHFRAFLFAVDALFITACLYANAGKQLVAYATFSKFLEGLLYLLFIIVPIPFLSAMSLGWLVKFSLRNLVNGTSILLSYCLLGLVFIANARIMQGFGFSGQFSLAGIFVEITQLYFLFVSSLFAIVYRKIVFNKRVCCCETLHHWFVS